MTLLQCMIMILMQEIQFQYESKIMQGRIVIFIPLRSIRIRMAVPRSCWVGLGIRA